MAEVLSPLAQAARIRNEKVQMALKPTPEQSKVLANNPNLKTQVAAIQAAYTGNGNYNLPQVLGYGVNKPSATPTAPNAGSSIQMPQSGTMSVPDALKQPAATTPNALPNQTTGDLPNAVTAPLNNTPQPAASQPTIPEVMPTPSIEDTLQKKLDAMTASIMEKQKALEMAARQSSDTNKSTIRGNLGRIYGGDNFDSSEAAPILSENNRLNNELTQINYAGQQAMQNMNADYLNTLQNELAFQRQQDNTNRQQQFNNILAAAGLTGNLNGKETLAGRAQALSELGFNSEEEQKAFQNAMALMGFQLNKDESIFNRDMQNKNFGLNQLNTYSGVANSALQNALAAAGVTGQFNGAPTVQQRNTEFDQGLQVAALMGMLGGQPTLSSQQLALDKDNSALNRALQYAQLGETTRSNNMEDAYRYASLNSRGSQTDENGLSPNTALTQYMKAMEINSLVPGSVPNDTMSMLKQAAGIGGTTTDVKKNSWLDSLMVGLLGQ